MKSATDSFKTTRIELGDTFVPDLTGDKLSSDLS